jgi:hypothetical protein
MIAAPVVEVNVSSYATRLHEFLKEHRKVQEQEAMIADLKKAVETLMAHSREQDLQIQRVRDEVQMSRPERQLAASGHQTRNQCVYSGGR